MFPPACGHQPLSAPRNVLRALEYGRNCPNAGTPSAISSRLAITTTATSVTQVITPDAPARCRHERASAPNASGRASRERRYAANRALPRICSPITSRSGTCRWDASARRREMIANVRGTSPTSARAPATPRRAVPVKQPMTSSASVRRVSSTERNGRRRPAESVATARIRCRARRVSCGRSGRRATSASRWRARARRDHDHACPAAVGAPAQVEVLAVEADRRVEPAERAEEVGAHQEARRREREHVAHGVVLLLVDLAVLDDRVELAEAVDPEPDVLQPGRVRPLDELGADDARRSIGTAPRRAAGSRRDPARRRRGGSRRTRSRPSTRCITSLATAPNPGFPSIARTKAFGHAATDPVRQLTGLADDEEQRTQVRVVLLLDPREHVVEPGRHDRIGQVDDHHRDDRRRAVPGWFHEGTRLAVHLPCARSRSLHHLLRRVRHD